MSERPWKRPNTVGPRTLHTGPDMKKIRVNKHSEPQWSPPLSVHWRGFCLETSLDLLVCSDCVYLCLQKEEKPDKAEKRKKKKLVNKLVGHCSIIFPSACVQSSPSFNLHSPADNTDSLAPSCSACRYDLYQTLSLSLSYTQARTQRQSRAVTAHIWVLPGLWGNAAQLQS